ncbi:MAG: inosine/xanthosine triphosphatase [Zestosphaera sp.]
MRVCAGTRNPSKLEGIRRAFSKAFGDTCLEVVSVDYVGGSPQPVGLSEVLNGALRRARNPPNSSECDFRVGVEAGIIELTPKMYLDVQAAAVEDRNGFLSVGLSPAFQVPQSLIRLVFEGEARELEEAVELVYGIPSIGEREGVIHLLSEGLFDRTYLTEIAVLMALLPWINERAYGRRSVT